jgi:GNAT superfamily N-acetyltransferase
MFKNLLCLLTASCSLPAADYTIIEESFNPDVCNTILNGIEDFNIRFFQQKDSSIERSPFVIYAKDENSKVIGGLCGSVFGSFAHIEYLWVDEGRRLQGLGTQLFKKAETFAKTKNCQIMQLYTWSYQAVGFYEKLGFECIGLIPKWIENYDAVFLRKELN